MKMKRSKFERDTMDYSNNKIYDWHKDKERRRRFRPEPILRNNQSNNRSDVMSSSDYETSDVNTDYSDSERINQDDRAGAAARVDSNSDRVHFLEPPPPAATGKGLPPRALLTRSKAKKP